MLKDFVYAEYSKFETNIIYAIIGSVGVLRLVRLSFGCVLTPLPNVITHVSDAYTEGIRAFSVVITTTIVHLFVTIMFFQVSNVQSSNIAELMVNPATSECIVEYKSGGTYSYTNVDRVAIDDLLYARKDLSLGQWVNSQPRQSFRRCL